MKKSTTLLIDLLFFAGAVFFVILFWKNNLLLSLLLLLTYVLHFFLLPHKEDHVIFVVGAVLGSGAEIIATSRGIWSYMHPTVLNIPLWLPFAWGIGSVLIIRIAQALKRK